MWGQEVNKEGKKINLYFCWCWVRTSAWYLVLQVSRGYKMVVLTRAPMAPEVASDKDSRSMPIFKGFIQRKANWVSEKWKGKARRLRMLLKHPWIFELVNSEWLLRLEKKNSYYGTERESQERKAVKKVMRWHKKLVCFTLSLSRSWVCYWDSETLTYAAPSPRLLIDIVCIRR